jgi:putative hemolysin
MHMYQLLIIILMMLLNGLFAGYELALATVRLPRLKALAEARARGADAALMMRQRMEASMAVVQMGITLSAALAGAIGGATAYSAFAPVLSKGLGMSVTSAEIVALVVIVVPLAMVTILIGELLPKVFAIRNPERVCLALGPSMRVFFWICYPAVWVFEWTAKATVGWLANVFPPAPADQKTSLAEFRAQVTMLRAANFIGIQQEQIMVQAARLSTLTVRDIMLAVADIVMLYLDAPLSENIIVAHLDLHTRFPVTEEKGNAQRICGYVNFKEMVFLAKTHPTNPSLREIARPILRLDAGTVVSAALRQMIAEHVHLALVAERSGEVIGMITQEDVFEELVGDIQDEFDRLPHQINPSGNRFVIGGGATIGRVREILHRPDLAPQMQTAATVNDWITQALARLPRGGDTLQLQGVSVLVRKVYRKKVSEILLDPAGDPLPTVTLPLTP